MSETTSKTESGKVERYSPLFVLHFGWVIQDDLLTIGTAETEESAMLICNALNAADSSRERVEELEAELKKHTDLNLSPVAIVTREPINEENWTLAEIRWIYNPVPEGSELWWSHPEPIAKHRSGK
jgi:hypothetical protein